MNLLNTGELYVYFEMVEMVNFTLCVFTIIKNLIMKLFPYLSYNCIFGGPMVIFLFDQLDSVSEF